MAKKNQVYIDIIIDDKGTTKRVAVNAAKLGIELDKAGKGADKAAKRTDKLNKSAKTLDRNMRGTAKMSGNQTKEFSKMQQGMGGLVGAYATLAAQVFAVSAAFQFLQSASDLRNLIDGQRAMGAITGTAYKTITHSIQEATGAQLKFADAARGVAIGTAAGLSSGQLERLASAAKNVSFALGRDLTDSYNRLIRGVTKAEPELLDELGIILRLDTALSKYSITVGKTVKELSAFERGQAVAAETLEQAERKFSSIEALMSKDAVALAKFTKSFDELSNVLKKGVITGLTPVFNALSDSAVAMSAAMLLIGVPIVKGLLPDLKAAEMRISEQAAAIENDTKDFEAQQKRRVKALKVTQRTEAEAARASSQLMDQKGVGRVGKGGMMAYLTDSKVSDNQSKMAARRAVENAKQQIAEGATRTGNLRKLNIEELNELDDHITKKAYRVDQGQAASDKKDTENKKKELDKNKKHNKKLGLGNKAAGAAVKGAGGLLKGAGYLGIALVIFDVIKFIYNHFNKLSDELQIAQDKVGGMVKKYKNLNNEMRYSMARTGSLGNEAAAVADGNRLASIDIKNLTLTYRDFREETDKSTKGYKEQQKQFAELGKLLKRINPEFKEYGNALINFTDISAETSKQTHELDTNIREIGSTLQNMPEIANEAAVAMKELMEEFIVPTKSEKGAQKIIKEIESIAVAIATHDIAKREAKIAAADEEILEIERVMRAEEAAYAAWLVRANDKNEILSGKHKGRLLSNFMADTGVSSAEKQEQMSSNSRGAGSQHYQKGKAFRNFRFPFTDENGKFDLEAGYRGAFRSDANIQARAPEVFGPSMETRVSPSIMELADPERTPKEIAAEQASLEAHRKEKERKEAILGRINQLIGTERQIEQDILGFNLKQAKMQTLGYSIEGKILNQKAKMLKLQVPLLKAQAGEARANRAYEEAKEDADMSPEQLARAKLNYENSQKLVKTEKSILEFKELQGKAVIANLHFEREQTELAAKRAVHELDITKLKEKIQRVEKRARGAPAYRSAPVLNADNQREMAKFEVRVAEFEQQQAQSKLDKKRSNLTLESVYHGPDDGSDAAQKAAARGVFTGPLYSPQGEMQDPGHPNFAGKLDMEKVEVDLSISKEKLDLDRSINAVEAAGRDAKALSVGELQRAQVQELENVREMALIDEKRNLSSEFLKNRQILLNRGYEQGLTMAQQNLEEIEKTAIVMTELQLLQEQKQTLANGIQSNMESAFMALVDGSKNAKQAFADMAVGILKMIAQMIVQMLVLKMLQSAMPSLFPTTPASTPAGLVQAPMATPGVAGTLIAKKGGIFGPAYAAGGYSLNKNNFSRGGMARGAEAGYAATLHGNEAVVPLPDNRSIPVTLNGAGSNQNNVTISVNMDNGGSSKSSSDSQQGEQLGTAISAAVQKELLHQKRSGGILNPYGAS